MTMRERFEGLIGAAVRRPVLTLAVALALAIGGGVLALGMQTDAGADTFVSGSTASARATADDHQHFGGDAVVILIREPLTDLVETKDLAIVSQLEACLAGQTLAASSTLGAFTAAPVGQAPYGGWSQSLRPAAEVKRGRGRIRARDVPEPRRRRGQPGGGPAAHVGQAGGAPLRARGVRARGRTAPGRQAGQGRRQCRRAARALKPGAIAHAAGASVRTDRAGPDRRRLVHPPGRVRRHTRRGPAQGALQLPVPDRELGTDPGAAEAGRSARRSRRTQSH